MTEDEIYKDTMKKSEVLHSVESYLKPSESSLDCSRRKTSSSSTNDQCGAHQIAMNGSDRYVLKS